jgi:hypothetical protein
MPGEVIMSSTKEQLQEIEDRVAAAVKDLNEVWLNLIDAEPAVGARIVNALDATREAQRAVHKVWQGEKQERTEYVTEEQTLVA